MGRRGRRRKKSCNSGRCGRERVRSREGRKIEGVGRLHSLMVMAMPQRCLAASLVNPSLGGPGRRSSSGGGEKLELGKIGKSRRFPSGAGRLCSVQPRRFAPGFRVYVRGDQSEASGPQVERSEERIYEGAGAGVSGQFESLGRNGGVEALAAETQSRDREEESVIVRTAWEKLVRWSKSWQSRHQANALQNTGKVAVLGGGSFGTAMAVLLARNKAEMEVTMLVRDEQACGAINDGHVNPKYFPSHRLPANVRATTDARAALEGAAYCVHAVPVQYSAGFLRTISEHVPPALPFISVSKGLELSTLEMMSQLIPRALGNPRQPVVVLSGPSFSIELMDELPTALVAASKDKDLAKAAQQLLASRHLRVHTSGDVVGVEMAGALKNVLAIAAGIVEGMNLGNNCMAALVAQGCAEIRWLAEKMGAKPATLAGLSGTGDIMLTCFVKLSRNRSVGVRLGAGEKLEDIIASMNQVAEGVGTAGAVIALARKYRVQMPILTAVARILENELTPKKAVLALMSLPQGEEV